MNIGGANHFLFVKLDGGPTYTSEMGRVGKSDGQCKRYDIRQIWRKLLSLKFSYDLR